MRQVVFGKEDVIGEMCSFNDFSSLSPCFSHSPLLAGDLTWNVNRRVKLECSAALRLKEKQNIRRKVCPLS